MRFYTSSGLERPVLLCEETRRFAYDSLNGRYGKEVLGTPCVSLDCLSDFENLSELDLYNAAIYEIAAKAPIRICDGEKISGSASLGDAILHKIPATFNGKHMWDSVSHLTVDFETVLKKGINHIRENAIMSLEKHTDPERIEFLKSCIHCIDCMRVYHERLLEELSKRDEFCKNYQNLKSVPFLPAWDFHSAVQSLWFTFAFIRLCGNWPGIGRLDVLLGDYLEKDLRENKLTLNEAREILAHFFIKGCEWVGGSKSESGDAQHYQNIVLAGIDVDGNEVTNSVTYLSLDIIAELGIGDFPTTVRVNSKTSDKLLSRVAEVIRFGGGIIAVYNEDLILDSLTSFGYDLHEARCFANDGCWEVQIPGKTYFIYQPFDSLQILQRKTLNSFKDVSFDSFEMLYKGFIADLKETVYKLKGHSLNKYRSISESNRGCPMKKSAPCTVVSLFENGCIDSGLSYHEGGPVYNVVSPHIGGLPDTVNFLYALKKLVFDEKKVSFQKLMEILASDWENNEELRLYAQNRYSYYGNDNDEVDTIAARIIEDFADACEDNVNASGILTPCGVSTFGRQLEWRNERLATASGKKAHSLLSGNFSPTPGTDKDGATAVIRSYCKSNLKRAVTGAALDIKLTRSMVAGSKGVASIVSLIKGFCELGGYFLQLDTADAEILRLAQENPEDYKTLSVRVSGWNARFLSMSKEWQEMIIERQGK